MPQPDSGDNCCDCPTRTSPCDDCGPPPAGGACCRHAHCTVVGSEAECLALGDGAVYQGDGTACTPANPCFSSGCSECLGISPFGPDGDGKCWSVQNCDGSYDAEVPCDTVFLTQITTCCPDIPFPGCVGGSGIFETIDPVSCDDISSGDGCVSCSASNSMYDSYLPCTGGFSPPP